MSRRDFMRLGGTAVAAVAAGLAARYSYIHAQRREEGLSQTLEEYQRRMAAAQELVDALRAVPPEFDLEGAHVSVHYEAGSTQCVQLWSCLHADVPIAGEDTQFFSRMDAIMLGMWREVASAYDDMRKKFPQCAPDVAYLEGAPRGSACGQVTREVLTPFAQYSPWELLQMADDSRHADEKERLLQAYHCCMGLGPLKKAFLRGDIAIRGVEDPTLTGATMKSILELRALDLQGLLRHPNREHRQASDRFLALNTERETTMLRNIREDNIRFPMLLVGMNHAERIPPLIHAQNEQQGTDHPLSYMIVQPHSLERCRTLLVSEEQRLASASGEIGGGP